MESEIFQILECLYIDANIEQKYIKELIEIIKIQLLPIYKNQRFFDYFVTFSFVSKRK